MPAKVVFEGAYIFDRPIAGIVLVDIPSKEEIYVVVEGWISKESEVRNVGEIGTLVLESDRLYNREERVKLRVDRINVVVQETTKMIRSARDQFDQNATKMKKYKSFLPPNPKKEEDDLTSIRFENIELE